MVSKVEKWKNEKNPIELKETIYDVYSKEGIEAVDEAENPDAEYERLKWYGLYRHNDNSPNYFMHRVKVPNGVMTAEQVRKVGEVTKEYCRGDEPNPNFGRTFVDVTTRQDLQIHWVDIRDIVDIWDEWDEVDLPTGATGACGDVFRNIVGCPVAGVDKEELIDASDIVDECAEYFTREEFSNLPRKYKVAISGCKEGCEQGEINDIGMHPAVKEIDGEEVEGFNVMAGGGLGRGGIMAKDMDVFVEPENVLGFNRAAATVFREKGDRDQRARARLRYKIEEEGVDWFRQEVEKEADIELHRGGESFRDEADYNAGSHYCDHVGIHEQKDGNYYAGLQVITGRLKADWFIELADLAEEYGDGTVRLTQRQNVILTGIEEEDLEEFKQESLLEVVPVDPSPFRRGAISCTGTEFCNLALIETKNRMVDWITELEDRVEVDSPLRIHLSGCNASCAQPQIADIAFQGTKTRDGDEVVEAVNVGIGGGLGEDPGFAEWVVKSVPCNDGIDAIEDLIRQYRANRKTENESFRDYVWRVGPENVAEELDA